MKDLRDRCEKLYQRMNAACVTRELKEFDLDLLESFAREMFEAGRNSRGIELGPDSSWNHTGPCQPNCTCAVALAIMASPEKGSSD